MKKSKPLTRPELRWLVTVLEDMGILGLEVHVRVLQKLRARLEELMEKESKR